MSRPADVDRSLLTGWPLPAPCGEADKDARGRVLAVAGGAGSLGAALLAGVAALRAGAGKLQIAAPARAAVALAMAVPEARVLGVAETAEGDIAAAAAEAILAMGARCDVMVVGPGLMDEAQAGPLALALLAAEGPDFVLDAAALTGLAGQATRVRAAGRRLIVTPHAGEMAALLGVPKPAVLADPLAAARTAAAAFQAVVVMKGRDSFIVTPDGAAWRHVGGVHGLGTCGSGDVLAGLIAGLLARGATPAQAAVWGVFAHGQAGRRLSGSIGPLGFLAREILGEIAPVLAELAGESGHVYEGG
jgi:ADP-dependent NAD(P)H-hydrate dehydratase